MGWDPECRKESISIMKLMDNAATKLITAKAAAAKQTSRPRATTHAACRDPCPD